MPFLSLPVHTSAGLLSNTNCTTGRWLMNLNILGRGKTNVTEEIIIISHLFHFLFFFFFYQCSTTGLYSNVPFSDQSLYSQPRLAPQDQELQPKSFPKPIYSYRSANTQITHYVFVVSHFLYCKQMSFKPLFFFSCLIAMALKNSKTGSLPVSEIYSFMKEHFPYFKVQSTINVMCQI